MTGKSQASPSNLPTGTLTFLFTDVAGSTRLWESYPEQMRLTMARHDELIESIAAQHRGVVVRPRGEGDSRFIVFTSATDAVIAAVAIQRQFAVDCWVASSPMRVRMALHTGEADLRDGDYYGSAVNRCAKLRNAAYGGQILLSQTTCGLVKETLPAGVGLRDLGEHQLKDLRRPEHIFQLTGQGLIPEFPAIKTPGRPVVIRPPDHRLRVYLSSVLDELAEERQAARHAILNLRLTPVMLESGARSHPAQQLYQAYLAQSHIFIAIYGQGYGWVPPGLQISALEDQYNLAASLPALIYIKDPAENRDPGLIRMLERINAENAGCIKSFTTPEMLGELVENDLMLLLSEYFETARSMEAAPGEIAQQLITNVPIPRNQLIGRERELAEAYSLLLRQDIALVTLTGAGGVGKSRLGIQIALELRDRFTDGVYLVALESISDPELVIPAIANTLGVTEAAGGPLLFDLLTRQLRSKHVLLLLDNFEQVLPAAPQIANLLEACPRTKMIVTSRAPLHLRAEIELPVPPLALPPLREAPELQRLSQYSAVQLFIQRAQGVKPNFSVTNQTAPAIAEICNRLDGLPLAIELASARIKMLTPQALLRRLERRFDILRGGTRDLPERQRTLYSAIDWSYNLLDAGEKRLLRQLAVFVGGWTLEAAEAVCGGEGDGQIDVFDGLERLIDNSLIKPPDEIEGEPRLRMLESIREFALERLHKSGEFERVRERQAQYYLTLVQQAEPDLTTSRQAQWIKRLDAEHGNIRLVLAWSQQHDVELGLKLCVAIWHFWAMHGLMGEGRAWLETFLAQSHASTASRAEALHAATVFANIQGDYQAARVHMEQALSISQQLGDQRGIAVAYNELGLLEMYHGDYAVARQFYEQSLTIKRALGEEWLMANTMINLGMIADYLKDYESAYTLLQQSLAIFRAANEASGMAISIGNLGYVAMHLGRWDEARALHTESLQLFYELGDTDGMAECLERLAMLAHARAKLPRAAQLFGAASMLRKEAGTSLPPTEHAEYEKTLEETRLQLDAATFDTAWANGLAFTLEDAVAWAVNLTDAWS